jgi:hypothetical protein
MAGVTKISYLLRRGKQADALASVAKYRTVVSEDVPAGGDKVKCLGCVMHVSKAKKLIVTRMVAKRTYRHEVSYFRLVFCRQVHTFIEVIWHVEFSD